MKFKQVIWIDETEFVCTMAKKILEVEEIACYTISDLKDESISLEYLVRDLEADCIVVDLHTMDSDKDYYLGVIEKIFKENNIKVWAMGNREEKESVLRENGIFSDFVEKPLSPNCLRQKITAN